MGNRSTLLEELHQRMAHRGKTNLVAENYSLGNQSRVVQACTAACGGAPAWARRLPERVKMRFFVQETAPKRVPRIFPASVCATGKTQIHCHKNTKGNGVSQRPSGRGGVRARCTRSPAPLRSGQRGWWSCVCGLSYPEPLRSGL